MVIEILIASVIVLTAVFMLYKNIKRSAEGKCSGCTGSADCPMCNQKNKAN